MGMFGGVEQAVVGKGGVYVEPGKYLVEINAVKTGKTRAREDFFVVEMENIESDNPDRPAGSHMSWMVMFKHESALGNIKQFVAAVNGVEEKEVDEATCELIVGAKQPLAGTKARIEAVNVKTRKGTDFTKVTWAPAEA